MLETTSKEYGDQEIPQRGAAKDHKSEEHVKRRIELSSAPDEWFNEFVEEDSVAPGSELVTTGVMDTAEEGRLPNPFSIPHAPMPKF